jgi:putative transposase
MRYAVIQTAAPNHAVSTLCRVLHVSRSGYYAWNERGMSVRDQENDRILSIIRDLRKNDHFLQTYGSPRITVELRALGIACNEKRIARIMHENGIFAIKKKKFRAGTDAQQDYPIAENLLAQDFTTERPNQVWLCDGTYIWTAEGWLVLAIVLDLHLRRCVGMATGTRVSSALAGKALRQALLTRRPEPGLIHHSDRGGEYAATTYKHLLEEHHLLQSMSRTANCWDNAPMESFFATLKKEHVYHCVYRTREEAALSIFEYIEGFYNTRRRHSSLGYLSPLEYEQKINRESTNPP